jgi:predicted nucleic acid-binding protein
VPDLLIAATGEVYGAVVVHYDRDFDTIAGKHSGSLRRVTVGCGV